MAGQSTVGNILAKLYTYDMNDWLGGDTYDANGNTMAASVAGGADPGALFTYAYDFENRILSAQSASSAVQIVYDGDGSRVGKIVDGVIIRYLVDDRNPTGYSQVLAELDASNNVVVTYTYGLDQISQNQVRGSNWVRSFYGYDGHGNVRFLTDEDGQITDTYDYDAFGTLIARSGTTPNNYLYCGEQFDRDLGLYFLRARYMNTERGRFWTMDAWEGVTHAPSSLHKYAYAAENPAHFIDPSGKAFTLVELEAASTIKAERDKTVVVVNIGAKKKATKTLVCKTGLAGVNAAFLADTHGHHPFQLSMGAGAIPQTLLAGPSSTHRMFHWILNVLLKGEPKFSGMGVWTSGTTWQAVLNSRAMRALAAQYYLQAANLVDTWCGLQGLPYNFTKSVELHKDVWINAAPLP